MDAVVAVVRPKGSATISREFRTSVYEVLLTDIRLPGQKPIKNLPKTTISFEEETADLLCTFVYNLTGAEYGGLKGKRAVFVPPTSSEPVDDFDVTSKGTLYCISVDSNDKLCPEYVDSLKSTPGFYSFDHVMNSINSTKVQFTLLTKTLLIRLENWLREKQKVPGAIDLLFSTCAEDRLKRSVTNPAYFNENPSAYSTLGDSDISRSIANEALAKMMAFEKCDKTIINPLFVSGSDLCYKNKVDRVVINKYYGQGKPDYNKIVIPPSDEVLQRRGSHPWTQQYPLHKAAFEGDSTKIKDLLKKEHYNIAQQDSDGWCPMHYAAWFGHIEAIETLLNDGGCSPNVPNANMATPLHVAASNGCCYVVELLLNHSEVDVNALDKNGNSALNMCESVDRPNWKQAVRLLKDALDKPAMPVDIYLMDGTYKTLKLISGANTTVQQLHQQMIRELEIPDSVGRLFTMWICSRSLQLQLKPEHKPLQHRNDWKVSIIPQWTDQDPSREDPQLFWRRDAASVQSMNEERKVKHPVAIRLLFYEAYHHYIKSLYPCAEQDVLILGGILMQLNQSDFDQKRCRNFFTSDKALNELVPAAKLRIKNMNWASRITAQYKHYSQTMRNRDRSLVILQQHFLTVCWNLTVYGSAFFTGYVQIRSNRPPNSVYVGVNDVGVHIINASNKTMLQSFSYKDIDYETADQKPVLEIRLKGNTGGRGGMAILTRQAGMIANLMKKLDIS